MPLLESEKKYCRSLQSQYRRLRKLYSEIEGSSSVSLGKREVTEAILLRMKAYYDTQNRIKKFLNKRYLRAGSDFFVETILFYLKLILDKRHVDCEVHSERQIRPERGMIRPDISIWKGDEVVAIIECKTQLGWKRRGWEGDFHKREKRLKKEFPDAEAFLVVLHSENWAGFPDEDEKVGKRYFTLSSVRPDNMSENDIDARIKNPIEDLFKQIVANPKIVPTRRDTRDRSRHAQDTRKRGE